MQATDKISVRLIVLFVAVATVLVTIFGVVSYSSSKAAMEKQLSEQMQRTIERMQIALPAAVWNIDSKQIDALLGAEMADPAVSGLMVQSAKDIFVAGRLRDLTDQLVVAKADSAPTGESVTGALQFDDSGQMKPVGKIQVYYTRTLIDKALRSTILQIVAQVVLLDLALIVAVVLGLNAVVLGSLNKVRSALQTISSGDADLTRRLQVYRHDEVGEVAKFFNVFVERLQNVIVDVRQSTQALDMSSSEIARGNLDLSDRTERQASALEQTAASMEEMTVTVKNNTDNARMANEMAMAASGVAAKGGAVVAQVVSTMGSINDSSKKIVDIISVIDGIAFQTNILALNAAVEAARAGEQGRGFAVVAAEVRSLAQRSAEAAKEIKSLIGDSVSKVEVGSKLVNDAGLTMNEIVSSVKKVTDIMGEILNASQEQLGGIDQINEAIKEMDSVTQQNAALVEEAAAAAGSMQDQAANLKEVLGAFRVD